MHQPRVSLFRAVALCTAMATCAQANDDLDSSWNGTGTLVQPVSGYNVSTAALVVQPDGRILLGSVCTASSMPTICMARLQPNGLRDYSFGPSETGTFTFAEFPSWPTSRLVRGLARQSDGRIIATGLAASDTPDTDNTAYALVARLDANGNLDPSTPAQPIRFEFAHNTISSQNEITAAALQQDGKLVVTGLTLRAGSNPPDFDFAVARLRTDLTLDPTFNGTGIRVAAFDLGGNTDAPLALAIQRDGKIVVAGFAATTADGYDAAVLRLNADGTPDPSFGNEGRATFDFNGHHLDDELSAVRIDGSGRIWVAGVYQWNGADTDFLVARLRTDGSLDSDFCGQGYRTVPFDLDDGTIGQMTDTAFSLLLQPDGKVVVAGNASNGEASGDGFDFAAARLNPDCSYDSTFGTGGKLHGRFGARLFSSATDASFGGNGIVLAGYAANTFVDQPGAHPHEPADGQFGVAMIRIEKIFANGFEP